MSEDSQIVVPPSFVALFVPPGRSRPTTSREQIASRYELCEDLATMLMDTARQTLWSLGITEDDVLGRIRLGLMGPDSVVEPAEARWVLRRLAELLDWAPLAPDDGPATAD